MSFIAIQPINLGFAIADSIKIEIQDICLGHSQGTANVFLCKDGDTIKNFDGGPIGMKIAITQSMYDLWDEDAQLISEIAKAIGVTLV